MESRTRGKKLNDAQDEWEKTLAKFRTWLTSRRLVDSYVNALLRAVRRGFSDPIADLESTQSPTRWRITRQAWIHWARWTDNDALRLAMEKLTSPRGLPPKVRILPTTEELRLAAENAAATPAPWGPMRWILYLSGLRIAEVCRIAHEEAVDALSRPEVIIRQKGIGGFARRTWTPGCLVRPALAALLTLPRWRESWATVSVSHQQARDGLRRRSGAFPPHSYRHAVARLIRRLGTPADVVSAVLGHDLRGVLGTTAIYAPPSAEEIEAAHARLAEHLWPNGLIPRPGSWLEAEACRYGQGGPGPAGPSSPTIGHRAR